MSGTAGFPSRGFLYHSPKSCLRRARRPRRRSPSQSARYPHGGCCLQAQAGGSCCVRRRSPLANHAHAPPLINTQQKAPSHQTQLGTEFGHGVGQAVAISQTSIPTHGRNLLTSRFSVFLRLLPGSTLTPPFGPSLKPPQNKLHMFSLSLCSSIVIFNDKNFTVSRKYGRQFRGPERTALTGLVCFPT